MKVLVSAGSKHGATAEIAEAIAAQLRGSGVEAVVLPPEAVQTVEGFDAAVIGSAVYMGRWVEASRRLVEREAARLVAMPVWLFSSGPAGDPLKPEGDPTDVAPLSEKTGAAGHRTFGGRIDRRRLGMGEKAVVSLVKAPDGDFRPWETIRAWAGEIASYLLAAPDCRPQPTTTSPTTTR